MGQKIETTVETSGKDRLVWSLIVLLLAGGVVAKDAGVQVQELHDGFLIGSGSAALVTI